MESIQGLKKAQITERVKDLFDIFHGPLPICYARKRHKDIQGDFRHIGNPKTDNFYIVFGGLNIVVMLP